MKKVILFAAVVAAMMTGCAKDDNAPAANDANAINFRVIGNKGKATSTETADFNNFKVWGVWDEDGTGTTLNAGFMENQYVEKDGAAWDYSPAKYWPTLGDVSFYAYSPSSTLNATYAPATQILGYVNPTEFKLQEDLLVASALDQVKAATPVTLPFSHALTQFVFRVKGAVDGLIYKVEQIDFLNINSEADFDYAAAEWGNFATLEDYPALDELSPVAVAYTASTDALDWTQVTSDAGYNALMLIPGSWVSPAAGIVRDPALLVPGESYIAFKFSVKDNAGFEYNTNSDNGTVYIPIILPTVDETTLDTRVVYEIELGDDLEAIEFTATLEGIDEVSSDYKF